MARLLLIAAAGWLVILGIDALRPPELLESAWLRWVRQASEHPVRGLVAWAALLLGLFLPRPRPRAYPHARAATNLLHNRGLPAEDELTWALERPKA